MVDEFENLPDHYETLDVPISSTLAEIKKAYHKIAREHHPDRNPEGDVELFKKATIAYELLREPSERQNYDLKLQRSRSYSDRGATYRSSFATSSRSAFREPFSASTSFSSEYFAKNSHAAASAASAASAAFKTFRSEASDDQKEYLRRPRQTKFSKRESPVKENPTRSSEFGDSPPSPKLSSSDWEDTVPMAEEDIETKIKAETKSSTENKPSMPDPRLSTFDLPKEEGTTKRKHDSTNANPKRRRRIYEMDELKNVSPLVEEFNSAFHLDTLSGALPKVTTKPRRRTYRFSPSTSTPASSNHTGPYFPSPQPNQMMIQSMISEYADASAPILSALMGLHNERFTQDTSQIQSVYENFVKTKALLEDLLVGTNNALHILESV